MKKAVKVSELASFVSALTDTVKFTWNVRAESFVQKEREIGSFDSAGTKCAVVTDRAGIVKSFPTDSKDLTPLLVVDCTHGSAFGGLCYICGQEVDGTRYKGYRIAGSDITHSPTAARKMELVYTQRLFDERKLILVLDIDHTLIHTCIARDAETAKEPETKHFVSREDGATYVVKFRPYLELFLKKAGEMFEVFVYTHGSEKYAQAVARLMDPEGKIVASDKVIGRKSLYPTEMKTLRNLLPSDQSTSVLIDDRHDVWANKNNLIQIFPFVHFDDVRSHAYNKAVYQNLPTHSKDCTLLYFTRLLRNIHSMFYDVRARGLQIADTRLIIPLLRMNVLSGTKVTLSGIGFPSREAAEKSNEFGMLIGMGAEYAPDETASDALVLARSFNEKLPAIRNAAALGRKVVQIWWLILSSRYWSRLPLESFLLSKERPKLVVDELALAKELEGEVEEDWKFEAYDDMMKTLLSGAVEEQKARVPSRSPPAQAPREEKELSVAAADSVSNGEKRLAPESISGLELKPKAATETEGDTAATTAGSSKLVANTELAPAPTEKEILVVATDAVDAKRKKLDENEVCAADKK